MSSGSSVGEVGEGNGLHYATLLLFGILIATVAVTCLVGTAAGQEIVWNDTSISGPGMMVDVNDTYNDTHMVYTVDDDAVYMANQSNGNVLWSSTDGQTNLHDTAAIGPRFIYSGNDNNVFVNDYSGTQVYNPQTGSPIPAGFLETTYPDGDPNGYFYVGNEEPAVNVFRKSDGALVYNLSLPNSGPIGPGPSPESIESQKSSKISSSDHTADPYVSSLYVGPSGDYLYVNTNVHTKVYSGIPSNLTLEKSWRVPNGDRDDLDSDSVHADDEFFYFSGDNGNVSVVEKGTWNYIANISVTGADVWSVDSDENRVHYAARNGNVYTHDKSRSNGFKHLETVDVGNIANSVDSDGERIYYAASSEVGAFSFEEDFEVNITGTNSPVIEGDDLNVEVKINNTGSGKGTQTIELRDTDFTNQIQDTESVTLGPGETTNRTLTWSTGFIGNGTGNVTVSSQNSTDTANVTINEAIDGCGEISSSGRHALGSNLTNSSTCIEITANDVEFDGNGFTIGGSGVASGDGEHGILVRGDNVTVENVKLDGWGDQLTTQSDELPLTEEEERVKNSIESGEEIGTYAAQVKSSGVLYKNSAGGAVNNVTATNNHHGIALDGSNSNDIANSTANSNRRGIYLSGSSSNNVTDNTANNNEVSGISISVGSNNNKVKRNTAKGNTYHGMYLFFASNNEVMNNIANGNNRMGISLSFSSDNTITSNGFSNNDLDGVRLTNSDSNALNDNTASGNRVGFHLRGTLDGSDDNTGTNNTAANNLESDLLIRGSSNNNSFGIGSMGTMTFEGMLRATSQPEAPTGAEDIGKYFDAQGSLDVSVGYNESQVKNESTLSVWGYDNGWLELDSSVNEEKDRVMASVEGSYETYGIFGGEITVFSQPLVSSFSDAPANTGELDSNLYEDLDGDGDGKDLDQTVAVFGELVRGNDLSLSSEQAQALDWDSSDDEGVTPSDMVSLFAEQIRAD